MFRKLSAYYRNLRAPVKASLWFLICGFLQKGISMLTTPIFTRIMSDAEYGRYSVYNSWLGIAEILITLNLAAGVYTRGLIKNEEDQDRFASSMLGLSTTCVLVWTVIYVIFHKVFNRLLGITTFLAAAMLLETWAHAAYQFWSNRERVHYRYRKLVAITITYVILRPLLGVVFVQLADTQHQVEARVLAMTLVNVIIFSCLYVAIAKRGKQYFNKQYWRYALRFNLPLLPHYLAQVALAQSDRLMINQFRRPEEVAYYSVAYTLAMVLQILNTSISGTMNPWIFKSIKAGRIKEIGKVSYAVLGVVAIANLAVIALAPELLSILAPGSYQAAIWVVPPVTASVYFMFLYDLFVTFEYYYERTFYVPVATIAGAVLNIILNAVFIPAYGFAAAGYTTLVCYVLYAFIHYCFMRKVNRECMDGKTAYDWRIIVALGVALIAGAAIMLLLYKAPLFRYGVLAAIVVLLVVKRKTLIALVKMLRAKE